MSETVFRDALQDYLRIRGVRMNKCIYCDKKWCFCVTAEIGRVASTYVVRGDEYEEARSRAREVSGEGGSSWVDLEFMGHGRRPAPREAGIIPMTATPFYFVKYPVEDEPGLLDLVGPCPSYDAARARLAVMSLFRQAPPRIVLLREDRELYQGPPGSVPLEEPYESRRRSGRIDFRDEGPPDFYDYVYGTLAAARIVPELPL